MVKYTSLLPALLTTMLVCLKSCRGDIEYVSLVNIHTHQADSLLMINQWTNGYQQHMSSIKMENSNLLDIKVIFNTHLC